VPVSISTAGFTQWSSSTIIHRSQGFQDGITAPVELGRGSALVVEIGELVDDVFASLVIEELIDGERLVTGGGFEK
jgi:hypothetical protein